MSSGKDDVVANMSHARAMDATVDPLARISEALKDLRYGTITVHVQDGYVVQIDRTEKVRLR